jgi:hypothetical protein
MTIIQIIGFINLLDKIQRSREKKDCKDKLGNEVTAKCHLV